MKCECGCGQETNVYRGKPRRYINGHYFKTEEARRKQSEAKRGKKGPKHTDETKRKIAKAKIGSKNPQYGKHPSEETRRKLSESRTGSKNHQYGKPLSDETKRKKSEAMIKGGHNVGEKSSFWRGGISYAPYCSKFNNRFKDNIRNKFNNECFLCKKSQLDNGAKLAVHHVNYDKNCLCNDIKCHFVPLCRSCHAKTSNGDREQWEELIMSKLIGDQ